MSDSAQATARAVRRGWFSDPVLGAVLLASGLGLIAAVAFFEERDLESAPWAMAVFSPDGAAPWDGTTPIAVRKVPMSNFPDTQFVIDSLRSRMGEQDIDAFQLNKTEWVLAFDAPSEFFAPVLESGRLPKPGAREVLAGCLARLDRFEMDGASFQVVGRLRRDTGALAFAYVLPDAPVFRRHFHLQPAATIGWFDADPDDGFSALEEDALQGRTIVGGEPPARRVHTLVVILGLVCVATGGAVLHVRIFNRWAFTARGAFAPFLRAHVESPFLVMLMHVVLYGPLFLAMLAATRMPVENMRLHEFIVHTFSEGSLDYVGDAYQSGNVWRAAGATWVNNYLLQTLGLTFVPSLVVPFVGVLKTLGSFVLAGFALSPLWAGNASRFVFHAITMTLELEAYILACVAICLFPIRLFGRSHGPGLPQRFVAAWRIVIGAALLCGIMLAIAGLYEALTLILIARV